MPFYKITGEAVELGREIARGGQGVIYEVLGNPHCVAKIYCNPSQGLESKLTWMKNNPPEDPTRSQGHASLAWPGELVYDERAVFVGYLMPYIQNAVLSLEVYHPYLRALSFPDFNLKYLTRAARNLASALGAIHARGYVVGDLNESNVLITRSALVTLIDNDSFQVQEVRQERIVVYPCPVGKPEYTPPELYGKSLAGELRRPEHDSFALAVLIFQLLMEGNHPFRSRWLGPGDPPAIEEKIYRGYYPYHKSQKNLVSPPPDSPPIGLLHPDVVDLFSRCFVDGCQDNQKRPSPAEWEWALKEAERSFIVCKNQHCFSDHLKNCPECGSPRMGQPRSKTVKVKPSFLSEPQEGFSKKQRLTSRNILSFFQIDQQQRERLFLWIAVFLIVLAFSFLFFNIPVLYSVKSIDLSVANRLPSNASTQPGIDSAESAAVSPGLSPSAGVSPSPDRTSMPTASVSPSSMPQRSDAAISPSPTPVKSNPKPKSSTDPNATWVVKNLVPKKSNITPANLWISPSPEHRISSENATEITGISKTKGLGGAILGLNYSNSVATAATALKDKTIKLWNPKDQSLRAILSGHLKGINAVAFSRDGTLVASGSDDTTVRVWKNGSGLMQKIMGGPKEKITCIAFSPDGKFVAAGSADNNITIWDWKDESVVTTLIGHREDITCIAFSPNGKILASGSNDNSVCLWNVADGSLIGSQNVHYRNITCLAFSPDGKRLISGSRDNTVRVWETNGLTLLKTLKAYNAYPSCIEYSRDGEIFAVGFGSGVLQIWDSDTQTLYSEIVCSEKAIKSLSFASNDSVLLAGSADGCISVLGVP